MTLPNTSLAHQLVERLNGFVGLDPIGFSRLVNTRVATTPEVADHEALQVAMEGEVPYLGFLGVLNGICGGVVIAGVFDDAGVLTHFTVRE